MKLPLPIRASAIVLGLFFSSACAEDITRTNDPPSSQPSSGDGEQPPDPTSDPIPADEDPVVPTRKVDGTLLVRGS